MLKGLDEVADELHDATALLRTTLEQGQHPFSPVQGPLVLLTSLQVVPYAAKGDDNPESPT